MIVLAASSDSVQPEPRCDWCSDEARLFVVELCGYRFVVCGPVCHWDLVIALSPELLVTLEESDVLEVA